MPAPTLGARLAIEYSREYSVISVGQEEGQEETSKAFQKVFRTETTEKYLSLLLQGRYNEGGLLHLIQPATYMKHAGHDVAM